MKKEYTEIGGVTQDKDFLGEGRGEGRHKGTKAQRHKGTKGGRRWDLTTEYAERTENC